jgi:NADPH-dependent 2,4-dienoyl-CoA reductase/sulfur reductase-like enzyme
MSEIVIIGNGVAGITAARHIRKLSDHRITVISSESRHFFSRTALMYIFMGQETFDQTKPYEDWFWEKNRIELLFDHVESVETGVGLIRLKSGAKLSYDRLLFATGSESNFFGWPGQDLRGVQGLYSLQDLEQMEANTKGARRAVIVGGGLIGVEMAEMLLSRGIAVTYLIREKGFAGHFLPPEESEFIGRHVASHGVDLRLETELKEIRGDASGRVRSVLTSRGDEIPCDFVGLTVGVKPRIQLAKASGLEVGRGILVDEHLEASVSGVFAAGDCTECRAPRPGRRAIEPVWYTGKMQGEIAARNLCGARAIYDPGIWFNSAKFFDVEYQVYGDIRPTLPAEHRTLVWSDGARRMIRINWAAENERVLGFNLLGVRYRHKVCEEWIRQGATVGEVLAQLGAANFDPEFFPQFEADVVARYNAAHPGREVVLKRRRGIVRRISDLLEARS